jgi:hypothetical protein
MYRVIRWILFFAILAVGSYVGFRVPFLDFIKIPESLRLVLNMELVALATVSVLELLLNLRGLGAAAQEAIWRIFGSNSAETETSGG